MHTTYLVVCYLAAVVMLRLTVTDDHICFSIITRVNIKTSHIRDLMIYFPVCVDSICIV